jgi:hypothetical protein
MTQSISNSQSILNPTPYRNPRHEQEAAELAEYDRQKAEAHQEKDPEQVTAQPEHNWEKRYKDLQSYNSRKINELQDKITALQSQQTPQLTVPKTPEEMEAFKQKNPETFAFIESMVASRLQEQMSTYDQNLAKITGDLMETKIEKATRELKAAHPDYEQIVADDRFHSWAEAQSEVIQDWIYNNPDKPELASKALSLFKVETNWGSSNNATKQTPQGDQGDLAVNARSATHSPETVDRNHPAYIWKESEIAKMRPEEFSKWDQHISLAQSEGRIAFGQ